MAKARTYPKANTTAQWFEENYARTTMNPVSKLLLHSTETAGWPGYDGGASAPTITYNPWVAAGQRWRQHNYLDRSARALRDPSGTAVRENQDGVVQVEIICYCDPELAAKYGKGVDKLPDHAYEDLGAFLAFLHTEYAVPLVRAPKWSTFPPPDSIRMSGPEYDLFRGVLGHQHASGNTHGDPGMTNAQVDRILAVAKRLTAGTGGVTPSPPKEDDMPTIAEVEAAVKRVIETHDRGLYDAAANGTEGVWHKQDTAALGNLANELRKHDAEEDGRYRRYEQLFGILGVKLDKLIATLGEGGDINTQLDRIEDDTDDDTAVPAPTGEV